MPIMGVFDGIKNFLFSTGKRRLMRIVSRIEGPIYGPPGKLPWYTSILAGVHMIEGQIFVTPHAHMPWWADRPT